MKFESLFLIIPKGYRSDIKVLTDVIKKVITKWNLCVASDSNKLKKYYRLGNKKYYEHVTQKHLRNNIEFCGNQYPK